MSAPTPEREGFLRLAFAGEHVRSHHSGIPTMALERFVRSAVDADPDILGALRALASTLSAAAAEGGAT